MKKNSGLSQWARNYRHGTATMEMLKGLKVGNWHKVKKIVFNKSMSQLKMKHEVAQFVEHEVTL